MSNFDNIHLAATRTSFGRRCTPFSLPSNGVISMSGSALTLTADVLFVPECTGQAPSGGVPDITGVQDPFYASTTPQTYGLAAATVIAWILVVMLVITPRTSFMGLSGAAPAFSNGHGIIGGATGGGTNLIGVGSRPWLQKVAALTVAVSLTIATADFFEAASAQYASGYMYALELRDAVLGSLEIRITRIISDIFVWLAQVQTLIRLFPRHKEKVLIKWIGFALILLDTLFSCINSFVDHVDSDHHNSHSSPHFVSAIPAVTYLFELALSLLYAAWVVFYSVTKRRYAYYNSKMKSITLIALLSLIAILTPVIFFVTDVSNTNVAGWGDYFRWVGAAAASVVVWEWVERIEALERDEKKDGILGREVFDGDEMLDVLPSEEVVWAHSRNNPAKKRKQNRGGGDGNDSLSNQSSALEAGFSNVAQRFRNKAHPSRPHFPLGRAHSGLTTATAESGQVPGANQTISFGILPHPKHGDEPRSSTTVEHPAPVASPVSRADTTSAASTVYVVHYDTPADVTRPRVARKDTGETSAESGTTEGSSREQKPASHTADDTQHAHPPALRDRGSNAINSVFRPFKRKRGSPPQEIQQASQGTTHNAISTTSPSHNYTRWDLKGRLGVLAAETSERLRDRGHPNPADTQDLPLTVIPAPPRGGGRTWSPATIASASSPALVGPAEVEAGHDGGRSDSARTPTPSSGSAVLTEGSASRTPDFPQAGAVDQRRASRGGSARNPAAEFLHPPSTSPSPSISSSSSSSRLQHPPPPSASDLSSTSRGAGGTIVIAAPSRARRGVQLPSSPASRSSPTSAPPPSP